MSSAFNTHGRVRFIAHQSPLLDSFPEHPPTGSYMPRTITITGADDGASMSLVLERALKLLDTASIKVNAAAQNIKDNVPVSATIVLRSFHDKPRAIRILERAGILIQL